MRNISICAVRDAATQAFAQPMFVQTPNVAYRSFVDEVNRAAENNNLYRHPGDYELWLIGEYEEESGTLIPFVGDQRRCLCRGQDVQVKE